MTAKQMQIASNKFYVISSRPACSMANLVSKTLVRHDCVSQEGGSSFTMNGPLQTGVQ